MARISGVNIHPNRQVGIGLTDIYGIGRSRALLICRQHDIDGSTKMSNLTEAEISKIRQTIDAMEVEGDLRRLVNMNIKRKKDIKIYAGVRHRRGLPVRGQRTHTNAQTRKKRRRS